MIVVFIALSLLFVLYFVSFRKLVLYHPLSHIEEEEERWKEGDKEERRGEGGKEKGWVGCLIEGLGRQWTVLSQHTQYIEMESSQHNVDCDDCSIALRAETKEKEMSDQSSDHDFVENDERERGEIV